MEAFFTTMSVPAKFTLIFIVLLVVAGIGYLWRRLSTGTLSIAGPRGRQPRLAVIDAASVDGRRRLVLVRRDNVEHLLLIGGPTDILVEPNIDKTAVAPAMQVSPALRDIRPSPALESLSRPSPTYEPALPISREPIPREPISREPIHRPANGRGRPRLRRAPGRGAGRRVDPYRSAVARMKLATPRWWYVRDARRRDGSMPVIRASACMPGSMNRATHIWPTPWKTRPSP